MNIVFDELINNIISYAYEEPPERVAQVKIGLASQRLLIEITDEGIPFNPLSLDDPDTTAGLDEREIGGLGIHIVKQLMDDVSYQRKLGTNVLALLKNLTT